MKNLKFKLLLSFVLFIPNISVAASLPTILELDSHAVGSSDDDSDLEYADHGNTCSIEGMLDHLEGTSTVVAQRQKNLDARREERAGNLFRLKQAIRRGIERIHWLNFPDIPADISERWAEVHPRAGMIFSELEAQRRRLSGVEEVVERKAIESDILRLVAESDGCQEQLNLFEVYHTLADLKGLLEVCYGNLETRLAPLAEVVKDWYRLLGQYAATAYTIDDESEVRLAKVLDDLNENDTVYNGIGDDLYKILDVIHLIQGWVLMVKKYIELPAIHAESAADDEEIDDAVFERKQHLDGILRALSLLIPDLRKAPLHFDDNDVDKGLELLMLNSRIETLEGKLVLLRDGATLDIELGPIDEELVGIRERMAAILELPTASRELEALKEEQKKLEELRGRLATAAAERSQEIKDLEDQLADTMHVLIRMITAIEEGEEDDSDDERVSWDITDSIGS